MDMGVGEFDGEDGDMDIGEGDEWPSAGGEKGISGGGEEFGSFLPLWPPLPRPPLPRPPLPRPLLCPVPMRDGVAA